MLWLTWFGAALGHHGVESRGRGDEGAVVHRDVVFLPKRHLVQEHDPSPIPNTPHCMYYR